MNDYDTAEGRGQDMLGAGNGLPYTLAYRVSTILMNMGVMQHLRGYRYLRDAIILVIRNGMNFCSMSRDVYPQIARAYGTSTTAVDLAMRHAIDVAWICSGGDTMQRFFGAAVTQSLKPSNALFVHAVAERISAETYREMAAELKVL
ncbi:MAG TPA: sporulation initiation factor Spo0A C-terminal domain-containing protein [Clostridia bacterium]|nr:sporulation initiation factor Spo0A C-terminal domain-containing protein [Clostridia bacterium]